MSVQDSPTAMHNTSNSACIRRLQPVLMYPSTMSMTPFSRGTPGTRKSTLVAMAISDVVSSAKADEATNYAINAESTKTM